MGTPGIMRPLTGWQRANVLAAAELMRDLLGQEAPDPRIRVVYAGLLEVLDPARRLQRQQRELAKASKAAVSIREKRKGPDRRGGRDRRTVAGQPPGGIERRRGDRRSGEDRRKQ